MSYRPSESAKNKEYERGYNDAKKGEFNPPTGSVGTDILFAPLDGLSGCPSTKEVAVGLSEANR